MDLNRFSSQILKAAIAVHKKLGPGLLESVYQNNKHSAGGRLSPLS
jgi:hypothetical protein